MTSTSHSNWRHHCFHPSTKSLVPKLKNYFLRVYYRYLLLVLEFTVYTNEKQKLFAHMHKVDVSESEVQEEGTSCFAALSGSLIATSSSFSMEVTDCWIACKREDPHDWNQDYFNANEKMMTHWETLNVIWKPSHFIWKPPLNCTGHSSYYWHYFTKLLR